MAEIRFVTLDGQTQVVQGEDMSIMELAVQQGIPGIDGDCGGVCSCATCHVHVAKEDMARVGQASDFEQDMLELTDDVTESSRLCCQIQLSDELDGVTLNVVRS